VAVACHGRYLGRSRRRSGLDTSLEGTHIKVSGSLQKGKDGPHIPYAPCMEYLPTFALAQNHPVL